MVVNTISAETNQYTHTEPITCLILYDKYLISASHDKTIKVIFFSF